MTRVRIAFGQQPCGLFPKRFLTAKIQTARRMRQELGGEIVWFYHDSDSDYRETITVLRDRQTGVLARLNFLPENKLQKKYSPLYARRIPVGWKEQMLKQLPRFVDTALIELFAANPATLVADFCLEMYRGMGLLDGITVVRSSDPEIRQRAMDLSGEFYADVSYHGEIVRARFQAGKLTLHRGGELFIQLPPAEIKKSQISPTRDQRFGWMQSVVGCTHYVIGASEEEYLDKTAFPEVTFVPRDAISEPEAAGIGENG